MTATGERRPAAHPRSTEDGRWRLRRVAVCVLFVAFCLNSSAGSLTPDTKTDLVIDPGRFLGRALQLWDPQGFAGQVQNQAYGYFFPMGPFFWVLHGAGVPGWVAQRLWWAALLSVAFLGVDRLARALGLGTPLSRLLAGVAYACSPHVLTLFSANSIESLPMCVAPWIVLPLVRGCDEGVSPRRAGLLCGVAVLAMGGVNAAADLAALLPAVLFLLTRRRSRRVAALAGWSLLGAALATVWFVVPLLLLGRYSTPFLDYIENADTTTSVTAVGEALRGTADWVAYLPTSGWHAGYLLLSQPVLVLDSMLVAAIGLAGVAATRSSHRAWLLACLGGGLLAVTFGHAGDVGALAGAAERTLLDTALSPVRNVHKFDLLIRLPLVLGLADLLPRLSWGRSTRERGRSRIFVGVVAVVAIVGTATPLLTLQLANTYSFTSLPGYWTQTANWLGAHAGTGRALLAPASKTPSYVWGTPTDEPLQPLARSAWEVRNNNPLTPPGHIRMLDTVDRLMATGVAQPDLASYLDRAGVRYLVVRNDLDYRTVQATPPAVVQATLAASPGLRPVARFGPVVGGDGDFSYSVDQGLQAATAAVEIWAVSGRGDARVATSAVSSVDGLSGGPESVAQLDRGVPGTTPPVVLTGTPGLVPTRTVLTDGLRRSEVNYGGPADQRSPTLTADDDGVLGRRVRDYLPVDGAEHTSVVRYLGARSVTASSSAADPDGLFAVNPGQLPYAALDDDPATAWHSAPGLPALGQWVDVRLSGAVRTDRVTVTVPAGSGVTRVRVETSSARRTVDVRDGVATARFPAAATGVVRVVVAGVRPLYEGDAAISGITVAGVRVSRTVVAPHDLPADRRVDTISFATPGDARTGCLLVDEVPRCIAGRTRDSEDGASLDRTFTLGRGADYAVSATVRARPGAALTRLLQRPAGYTTVATASSQAVPDPLASAQSVIDGDGTTGWVASTTDPDPSITLVFPRKVRLSRLVFQSSERLAATRPDRLRLTSAAGTRRATIGGTGTARFAPLTTDRVTLHLASSVGLRPLVASSAVDDTHVGIGVTEISVPGLATTTRLETAARPVELPCGSGPDLVLDGRRTATSVSTTVGALRDLTDVAVTVCGTGQLSITAGPHRLVAAGSSVWAATGLTLTRVTADVATVAVAAPRVTDWGRTSRSVAVAARTVPVLLTVQENVNPGWRATLHGRALTTVTVDGWRQGYVLPAGRAGVVELTYAPQRVYATALIVGSVTVLVLLVLVLVSRRRRSPLPAAAAQRVWRPAVAVFGVVVCLLAGGWIGAVAAAVTSAAVYVARRLCPWPVAPALAFAALVAVGALLAEDPLGTAGYAAGSTLLQVLGLVAVTAAVQPRRTVQPRRAARPAEVPA